MPRFDYTPFGYIAVGHGLKPGGKFDPGAVGKGQSEQSAGDVAVRACANRLRQAGLAVTDEAFKDDPAFEGTIAAVNRRKPNFVATFHHDVAAAPPGAFVYHFPGSKAGAELAWDIIRAVSEVGFPTRPAWLPGGSAKYPVAGRNLAILRKVRPPAVLIECGPIGAYSDAELHKFGVAAAVGILKWCGLPAAEPIKAMSSEDGWKRLARLVGHSYGTTLGPADIAAIVAKVEGRL